MTEAVRGTGWTLTREALDTLLLHLDPDRDRAGEKYESLRRKLIVLFEHRGCCGAEDCADDTITRVARRLEQGESIRSPDPFWYFLGVARNVARERHAMQQRQSRALERLSSDALVSLPAPPREDAPAECARGCLLQLAQGERALIIDYYRGDKTTRIANRRRLAERLQLAPNALRIRAHRIRQRLETCTRSCVDLREGRT